MAEEILKKVNLFGQDYVLKGSGGAAGGSGGGGSGPHRWSLRSC